MSAALIEAKNLSLKYGRKVALDDVSFSIPPGRVVGLLGHNGAGKTTLIRTLMGLIDASSGSIHFAGNDLRTQPGYQRAANGISYLPEDRRLIPALTVQENILLPVWANKLPGSAERLEWVYSLIPEIAQFRDRRAMQLSGGQQKLVALARALMPGNRLLILDEPFEGVAPVLSRRLSEVIAQLGQEGLCVLISESDDTHSADLVDALYRIERGSVRAG